MSYYIGLFSQPLELNGLVYASEEESSEPTATSFLVITPKPPSVAVPSFSSRLLLQHGQKIESDGQETTCDDLTPPNNSPTL
jgi:hypothetical protein